MAAVALLTTLMKRSIGRGLRKRRSVEGFECLWGVLNDNYAVSEWTAIPYAYFSNKESPLNNANICNTLRLSIGQRCGHADNRFVPFLEC